MNRYRWRTREDGMVVIQDVPGGPERALALTGAETRLMDKVESQWGEICRTHGNPRHIPDGWLQAMIYRESGGNPKALRKEPNGWTGVGLLQITHPSLKGQKYNFNTKTWFGGLSDEQVFDPDTNVGIAAKYVASFMVTYGNDFPRVAAAFNAGSARPSDANPWGLLQTNGHVSAEVAALNYWITAHKAPLIPSAEPMPELISLMEIAWAADDAARKDTLPPDDAA